MAIKIQTQQDYIPIEIGDQTLKFYITDENINRLRNSDEAFTERLDKVDPNNLEEQKEAIKGAIDYLLGDGSFDTLYGLSPSLINVVEYFLQICVELKVEVGKRIGKDPKEKINKYLQQKNKQNKAKNKKK